MTEINNLFMTKTAEKPHPKVHTYLYSPYKGVPLSRELNNNIRFNLNEYLTKDVIETSVHSFLNVRICFYKTIGVDIWEICTRV